MEGISLQTRHVLRVNNIQGETFCHPSETILIDKYNDNHLKWHNISKNIYLCVVSNSSNTIMLLQRIHRILKSGSLTHIFQPST